MDLFIIKFCNIATEILINEKNTIYSLPTFNSIENKANEP